MEIWQIWAVVGFIFLILEMKLSSNNSLVLSGACFFAGLAALMFNNSIGAQILSFLIFLPLFYFALKPAKKVEDKKNDETAAK